MNRRDFTKRFASATAVSAVAASAIASSAPSKDEPLPVSYGLVDRASVSRLKFGEPHDRILLRAVAAWKPAFDEPKIEGLDVSTSADAFFSTDEIGLRIRARCPRAGREDDLTLGTVIRVSRDVLANCDERAFACALHDTLNGPGILQWIVEGRAFPTWRLGALAPILARTFLGNR